MIIYLVLSFCDACCNSVVVRSSQSVSAVVGSSFLWSLFRSREPPLSQEILCDTMSKKIPSTSRGKICFSTKSRSTRFQSLFKFAHCTENESTILFPKGSRIQTESGIFLKFLNTESFDQ